MAKNQQNGIAQNLESEATKNSQPNKLFIPGSKSIPGADPEQPSINNATRREQYNIQNGIPSYDKGANSDIPSYISTPTPKVTYTTPTQSADSYIKEKTGTFATEGGDSALAYIKDVYAKKGIDGLKAIYGDINAQTYQQLLENLYAQGDLLNAQTGVLNTQSPNVQAVLDLVDEVSMARALGYSDAKTIAEKLGQDERVIQKIMNNQAYELVQLNDEYKQRQMRQYYQAEEDLGTQIARNMEDYQNRQRNADYQFNSAIKTLERQLFDSEWAAKETAGIYGMTGTKYMIDRIKTQYQQQMDDLNNTYQYQTATTQLSINRALEDFATSMERLAIEEDEAQKVYQAKVMETMTNLNNQVGLTIRQQQTILANLQTTIAQMKSEGARSSLEALENGYTTLSQQIAQAYGLDYGDLTTHQFTSQELGRTSTSTIGNDTNNLGHILASDDGTRIGTYKSPNGYTYNVYATREDGLIATQALLERAYYGKTLKDAAQKWIGQGKDISGAVAVLKELGLDPNAVLSDENVRKFMEAIGRREGTIKKGETLDDWVKGGKNLSSYTTTTTSVEGTTSTNFVQGYEQDYTNYLKNGTDGFKKASQEQIIQKFGSWDNFVANAQAYKNVIDKQVTDVADTMLKDMITLRDWLDSEGEDGEDHSMIALRIGFPGTDAHAKKRMYKQIIASDALQNLINLKSNGATFGALSNQELGFITEAANWFNLWDNEENFVGELNRKINKILDKYNMTESEFLNSGRGSEMPSATISSGGTGTASSVFNVGGQAYSGGGVNTTGTNVYGAYQSGTVNTGAQQMW